MSRGKTAEQHLASVQRVRAMREERREEGLCIDCPDPPEPARPGMTQCAGCATKRKAARPPDTRPRKRVTLCSRCDQPGHNARTCTS